ncbi:MAG: rhodanese-like domain-containing protein [bacterium]
MQRLMTRGWMFLALLTINTMLSASDELPMSTPGATTINAEQLIELAGENSNLIIVDARITDDRLLGQIAGSVSLPDIDTTCETLANAAPNTADPVVFYCNGVKCGRSLNSIKVAMGCGYKNMYWFRGGFAEWEQKKYPIEKE